MTRAFLVSASCAAVIALLAPSPATAEPTTRAMQGVDELPGYRAVPNVSGTVKSAGSSLTTNLMSRCLDDFREIYPQADVAMTIGHSSIGPPALIAGTAELAPMARAFSPKEREAFRQKWGYDVTEFQVALDAVAIYVEKDNPVRQLRLADLAAMFSDDSPRVTDRAIRTWGDLGVAGPLAGRTITLYGDSRESAAYRVFRDVVLGEGNVKAELRVQPVSSSIVQGVGSDPAGIGWASILYQTRRARPVALEGADGQFYEPTWENCTSGKYPLTRSLYVYVNKAPNQPIAPVTRELLLYLLSRQGQDSCALGGNFPLSPEVAAEQRRLLGK